MPRVRSGACSPLAPFPLVGPQAVLWKIQRCTGRNPGNLKFSATTRPNRRPRSPGTAISGPEAPDYRARAIATPDAVTGALKPAAPTTSGGVAPFGHRLAKYRNYLIGGRNEGGGAAVMEEFPTRHRLGGGSGPILGTHATTPFFRQRA